MKRFKKLMSVLITAVMLLQLVGITGQICLPVSAEDVAPVIVNAKDSTTSSQFYTYTGTTNNTDWADVKARGPMCIAGGNTFYSLNNTFTIQTEGRYNVKLAYGSRSTGNSKIRLYFDGSATIGLQKTDLAATYNDEGKADYLVIEEVELGPVYLTAADHTLKINLAGNNAYIKDDGTAGTSYQCFAFYGLKFEYVPQLAVDTVTANTSDEELSNNDEVSKGADTFKVKFNKNFDDSSVTDTTVGLYDGENLVPTYKKVVDDTVYLTVKKALDVDTIYTIAVNGVYDEYTSTVSNYTLNVETDTDGVALGSSFDEEVTVTNKILESAEDLNKRDVTVTGKILSSQGTPIEGRKVELKLAGVKVGEAAFSDANGVFNAKYEIPLEAESQTFSFTLAGEGVAEEEEKSVLLSYVSAEYEKSLLDSLKTATKDEIKVILNTNKTIFDIDPENDMPDYSGFDADLVYAQLSLLEDEEVEDVNKFRAAYNKAILLETINQAGAADTKAAVKDIIDSDEDCTALGIDKEKIAYIKDANSDALVDKIAAINVRDEETFAKKLGALAKAIDKAMDETLAEMYEKADAELSMASTATPYVGQSFDVSLDLTPAQTNLAEAKYVIEATNATILEDAVVTTEYASATEMVDGKLIVTITIEEAPVALSTDFEVGKVTLSAPSSAGSSIVTLSGTLVFDVDSPYPVVTDIESTSLEVITTVNSSEGITKPSYTPVVGTSPRPSAPAEDEEKPDDTKPGTTEPPVEDKPVSNFTDLAGNEWAIESINTLFEKGIISDNAEKIFRPNDNVTREEFVKMIVEALGLVHETYETDLNDVEKGAWYYPYVATAVEKGIVLGDENGNFRIGENISRQDMAVIIIRVITKLEHPYDTKSTKFADDKEISDYAKDAMYAAKNLGIINGVGDGMCAPRGTATRAMAAKVIYEMMRTVGL